MTTFRRWPFRLIATCLLPDHWHLVVSLPSGDAEYSKRLQRIKHIFTDQWLLKIGTEAEITTDQSRERRRGIWQPRFWEHTVRDERDLERCVDYIHWNPRKHNLVNRVRDWPWSSFHRFVREGSYEMAWGGVAPDGCDDRRLWGE